MLKFFRNQTVLNVGSRRARLIASIIVFCIYIILQIYLLDTLLDNRLEPFLLSGRNDYTLIDLIGEVVRIPLTLCVIWLLSRFLKDGYCLKNSLRRFPKPNMWVPILLIAFVSYLARPSEDDFILLIIALFPKYFNNTILSIIKYFSHFSFVLLIVVVNFLIGFREELEFRGFLLEELRQLCGDWWALLLSSIAFVVAHVPSYGWLRSIELMSFPAVIFGLLYLWQKSIWPSVLCHALANAFTTFIHLSQYDRVGRRVITSLVERIFNIPSPLPPTESVNTWFFLAPHVTGFDVSYGHFSIFVSQQYMSIIKIFMNCCIVLLLFYAVLKQKEGKPSSAAIE
jgi:membrane protease YdiL (CAAX protease family)